MAATAHATTITVTSIADIGGGCTLRAAIAAVDFPGKSTPCAHAAFGPNTIVLPKGRFILTAQRQLEINPNVTQLTITGAGESATTISGGGATRVFAVDAGAFATIEGVTVADGSPSPASGQTGSGSPGGAVLNLGTLRFIDAAILDSAAGDAAGGSDPQGGDGGAIFNLGVLSLDGVTLSGNDAGLGDYGFNPTTSRSVLGAGGDGGAIANAGGEVRIFASTLKGNAAGSGQAIGGAGGNGGAISADPTATVTLQSDTIAGNSAAAGGGVFAQAPASAAAGVTFQNTLLALNTGGNCSGAVQDLGANLSYGGSGCPSSFLSGDPMLGALQDNGGPVQTVGLDPGSAAIGAGSACPATDARGVRRQGKCAIGAYQPVAPAIGRISTTTTATAATIHAMLTVDAGAATATVRYRDARGKALTAAVSLGASVGSVPVTIALKRLAPGRSYGFTLTVTTADGAARSAGRTLRTARRGR